MNLRIRSAGVSRRPKHGLFRIGVAVTLLALSLMSARAVVWARPLPPEGGVIQGVINHACPDTYEIDDLQTSPQVAELSAGSPQARNFDGNTNTGIADKDWARIQVTPQGVYTVTTSNLSALTDTIIKLYDAGGNPVFSGSAPVENDDWGAADFGSQFVWTAPGSASGWYYVAILNSPKSSAAYSNCAPINPTVVSYTLSLSSRVPLLLYLPLVMR